MITPASEKELAEAIENGGPFEVEGQGSKRGLGRAIHHDQKISLQKFEGVEIYEPDELILEVGAATALTDIQKLLNRKNQMLAFDPPDHSHLWGDKRAGSMGGVIACGLAGSRRLKAGSARDHILGVRGVTGRAEIFNAGARVVKNVTGYDMPKLMTGSFGTLAALTRITLKVLPAPETEETVLLQNLDDEAAIRAMSEALQSNADISCAAHVPGRGTALRFEGIKVSVAARRDRYLASLAHKNDLMDAQASRRFWNDARDCQYLEPKTGHAIWRISVAPSEGAMVVQGLKAQSDVSYFYDWAGGLIWIQVPEATDVRSAVTEGHATLYAASEEMRSRLSVFEPQAASLAALTRRVKAALDPQAKLNPGRMYEGL